jgi:uncharacterized protein (DUF58 family)
MVLGPTRSLPGCLSRCEPPETMLTPEELKQLKRLHIQAGRRVDSPFAGGYRSAFRGRGMEFEEVRPYVPGDDVRHIDWNVTARVGAPHVKEFREERELCLQLVLDVSGSVGVGSGGMDGRTDKRLQIARLAGALAYAAIRNGDQVGLMTFTDRVERFLPPRKSRGHAWAVMRSAFERSATGQRTDLAGALSEVGRHLRRRSVVCVLSDFVSDSDYGRELAILARRHRVNCFVVHDPLETRIPNLGLVEVEDAETGKRALVDTAQMVAKHSLDERLRGLRRLGVRPSAVGTSDDPFGHLLQHFRRLEQTR